MTSSAIAAPCMLPARANARKYLRSSHANVLMGSVCNFADRSRNLSTARCPCHDLVSRSKDVGQEEVWATKLGLQQRCQYVAGDMFEAVPKAEAYSLKMILHDWSDAECIKILSNIRKAATGTARVFVIEHIVPEHNVPHLSKLFDIQMMCCGTGRERTEAAIYVLVGASGRAQPAPITQPIAGWDHHWRLCIDCGGRVR